MIEIFSELYKKVLGFFQTQEKENDSKNLACNRLKLVLMQDRTNLTPLLLERMKGEMIELLSKYVEMDKEALELNFEQEGDSMALMLSIPVLRAKDEEEIQANFDAEDKAKVEEEETQNLEQEKENIEETKEQEPEEVIEEIEGEEQEKEEIAEESKKDIEESPKKKTKKIKS